MMGLVMATALLAFSWRYGGADPTFVLTLESLEGIMGSRKVLVAGVVPDDCAGLPWATGDTFCASVLCPGVGQFRASVASKEGVSNVITFRVRDTACKHVDGSILAPDAGASLPQGKPCRVARKPPPTPVPGSPADPTMQVPSAVEIPHMVAVPHTEAPIIPKNPQVVAKVPHAPGHQVTFQGASVPAVPRAITDPPPERTVTIPTGPPQTIPVPLPTIESPGVPCP